MNLNIEKISIENAKMMIAAIEYYREGISSENKNKLLKNKKETNLLKELSALREKIECSEISECVTIKEHIIMSEKKHYEKLIDSGKTKEQIQDRFMYTHLF